MEEEQLKQIAAQLRKPHGEAGITTAEFMNKGNLHIHLNALAALNAEANDNILEIGMGNGFFVKDILSKHQSISYTGCDFSELMVEESEKLNAEWILNGQAKFVLADASSLPFANHSFNKILTINTIYFWEDAKQVLDEMRRVLKPGGKLIIALRPKDYTQKYPFIKYGFKQFSKSEVEKVLEENGFHLKAITENQEPDFEMNGEILKMQNLILEAQK